MEAMETAKVTDVMYIKDILEVTGEGWKLWKFIEIREITKIMDILAIMDIMEITGAVGSLSVFFGNVFRDAKNNGEKESVFFASLFSGATPLLPPAFQRKLIAPPAPHYVTPSIYNILYTVLYYNIS